MTRHLLAGASAAGLLGTVVAANALTSAYGLIGAGFGLTVATGTFAAGAALALRDVLHETGELTWVLTTVGLGCLASAVLGNGRIALASAVAFLLSELLDCAVYLPLRRRRWRTAVLASNVAGALVDSVVFLAVSGLGVSAAAVGGQLLVKVVWVTGSFLLLAEVVRRALSRQRVEPAGA